MKKYFFLASFVLLFGATTQAHSLSNSYPYQYSYQPQTVYVDADFFNHPVVYNPQYGKSTTRRVVPISNAYATVASSSYNTYGVTYNTDPYYKNNGSRYVNTFGYTQPVVRGTTSYAYGQKRYQPARVQYSHTTPCSY